MSEQKQNKMAVMPMGKLIFSMSLPLMVSLLVQSLYNIVDGIFVARISEKALTATSLAMPFQLLMIAASVGTSVGLNALLSRLLGAKKYQEANEAAATGMILGLFCTVCFMALGLTCADTFMSWFTDDPETAVLAGQYLTICMTFCLGIFVETICQRLLQAAGNAFLSMISLVVGAVVNIILDPVMIFGYFGCPAMGIQGAAIATVIGQWLGALTALLLHQFKNPEIRFAVRGYHFRWKTVAAIYQVGAPTILMQVMGSVMVSAVNSILMPYSSTAVAFFGVYYKLQNFLLMPINGLGQAAIPIIGFNYGAKNGARIRQALRIMLPAAVLFALCGTLVFFLLPGQLLALFSASGEMLALGVPALRIICLTFALSAVTIVVGYCCSGLGNGVVNMLGNSLRQVILFIPFAYLFAKTMGVRQVWYSIWISEAAAAVYALISLLHEYRKKVKPMLLQDQAR